LDMKILFKYATRSRPELFKRGMESIINNVASDNYHIVVSIDSDDQTMLSADLDYPNTTIFAGLSKNKIDAINRDMNYVKDWDIVINMSDDMVFTQKGFDDVIRNEFAIKNEFFSVVHGENMYNRNYDLCLHFPDQYQGANCMTMSIMGRTYYERDNFIYNPVFESLWCDVVAQEIAQIRGCYKFVDKHFITHLHPSLGLAPYDEQAKKTEGTREDGWAIRKRDYDRYLELKKEYDPTNIFPIRQL